MAMVMKRTGLPYRNLRTRRLCVTPHATSLLSRNKGAQSSSAFDVASGKQTGVSYVNLRASAADFESVLVRLGKEGSISVDECPAFMDVPEAQPKAWAGILDSLFGSLRGNKQPQSEVLDTLTSMDDGSPLSHAVVMFTATWCGPCSMVYRELRLAAGRLHGRPPTAIIVIDVEEEKELASDLGIKALPTLLYLGPDGTRGPIFTQGPVSASFILDTLERAACCGGRDMKSKWLKL